MCEYCQRYICPSGCPNAKEPQIFAYCEDCGEPIYDGDEYYDIGGHKYCEACVHKSYRTAEVYLDE